MAYRSSSWTGRTARSMNEAWGPYSKLTVLHEKTVVQEVAEYIGYIAAGLVLGFGLSAVIWFGGKALIHMLS